MATKNPRVVGYIQPATHEKLKQYMEEEGLSESKALDVILGEYFGIDVPRVTLGSTSSSTLDSERLAALEKQMAELKAVVEKKLVA
jgi:ATP-dependent RNA circularization protein (DNA/RNA ligase family)